MFALARPLLFRLDPERAHALTVAALEAGLGPRDAGQDDPVLAVELAGLRLPNPVGLAAGFDKDAARRPRVLRAGLRLRRGRHASRRGRSPATRGRACSGCPRTRPSSTGWASTTAGVDGCAARGCAARSGRRARRRQYRGQQGLARPRGRLRRRLRRVAALADYLTVNVSSPNTPGLRGAAVGGRAGRTGSGGCGPRRGLSSRRCS